MTTWLLKMAMDDGDLRKEIATYFNTGAGEPRGHMVNAPHSI